MISEEVLETKVILKFGYELRLCVSMKAAIAILDILSKENVMKCDNSYKSGKSTEIIKPWGTEEIQICMISPAELMVRTAAADMEKT